MIDQGKNLIIGLFVIAACMVLVISLLFLHPKVGDNRKTLRVLFTDIDKITVGTRVTFAGKPVGEVVEIREIPDARDHRAAHEGDVYVYELVLKVDSGINVYNSDTLSSRTSGLLGEKSISINPEPPKSGVPLRQVNNEIIYAMQAGSVEDTLKQFADISQRVSTAVDLVKDALQSMKDEHLWENIGKASKNIEEISKSVNKPKELEAIIDNVLVFTKNLPNNWEDLDKSLKNLNKASDRFLSISESGNEIMDKIKAGEGNLGQLIVGNDLYLNMKSILNKGSTIMDDINQYGILFHSNKKWQRLNARRLNLMNRLAESDEFYRYFNQEINQISASLSEVSMILRETERQPYYLQSLTANPEYARRFAELLQRAEHIEETLKMYNTQVVDCQE